VAPVDAAYQHEFRAPSLDGRFGQKAHEAREKWFDAAFRDQRPGVNQCEIFRAAVP
jgi:hypothetical protein